MTYKEFIKAEIERRAEHLRSVCKHSEANELIGLLSFIDSMQEEPDGDDLGVIATRDALAYANDIEDECINIDDVVQAYEDGMIAGAQWQIEKDSIPAKDLEEVISYLSKRYPEVSFAKLSRIAVRVAKWQKEQMMKDAVDDEVGYWNITGLSINMKLPKCIEDGDKVKVIVIKEG